MRLVKLRAPLGLRASDVEERADWIRNARLHTFVVSHANEGPVALSDVVVHSAHVLRLVRQVACSAVESERANPSRYGDPGRTRCWVDGGFPRRRRVVQPEHLVIEGN